MLKLPLSTVFLLFLVGVNAELWSFGGYLKVPKLDNFKGHYKVRVELYSGGLWLTKCGEAMALWTGHFSMFCDPGFHFSNQKIVKIYHRFWHEGECRVSTYDDIDELTEDDDWLITPDDDPADDSLCSTEIYD